MKEVDQWSFRKIETKGTLTVPVPAEWRVRRMTPVNFEDLKFRRVHFSVRVPPNFNFNALENGHVNFCSSAHEMFTERVNE